MQGTDEVLIWSCIHLSYGKTPLVSSHTAQRNRDGLRGSDFAGMDSLVPVSERRMLAEDLH